LKRLALFPNSSPSPCRHGRFGSDVTSMSLLQLQKREKRRRRGRGGDPAFLTFCSLFSHDALLRATRKRRKKESDGKRPIRALLAASFARSLCLRRGPRQGSAPGSANWRQCAWGCGGLGGAMRSSEDAREREERAGGRRLPFKDERSKKKTSTSFPPFLSPPFLFFPRNSINPQPNNNSYETMIVLRPDMTEEER